MAVTRFEGEGPVARYWLANCEGFAVKGGAHGVVEELIHDADPHVTTRFVVRTRTRRRKIVSASAVAAVVPAEKLVVVARERRRPRVRRPPLRLPSAAPLGPPARSAALAAGRVLVTFLRVVRRLAQPAAAVLAGSLRLLTAEARASGAMLFRAGVRRARRRFSRRRTAGRRRQTPPL
jgi:hypothetical protein